MKKIVVLLVIASCLFGMFGCSKKESPENLTYTEQDIFTMFTNAKEEDWDVIDSVVITDNAYDMVGAVLFWDNENETANVAFLDADGNFQKCGTYAKVADPADFSYLGNGKVKYKLVTDGGVIYNYTLTISIDGSDVHFKAEDDLTK